ncbi:hypothetical protein HUC32_23600 [Escherichia coli]|nr:hypothetical protein [Escherichia coli]
MMSLWDALRMNMMISYQELVRTFPKLKKKILAFGLISALFCSTPAMADMNRTTKGALLGKVRISRSFLPKLTR